VKSFREKLVHVKNSNPWLYLLWHENLRRKGKIELKKNSDIQSINKLYYRKANRYPDLDDPVLFSEKQQWLKLFYRNPDMPVCADKYEVRAYLEHKGYGNLLNELLAVYESVDEINIEELPKKFVIKAAHGSGWNIICSNKEEVNWTAWNLVMKSWLKHNIFWSGREWIYKDLTHRLVCEKYLEDESGGLMDYKFYCFNGEPHFVQANNGRGQNIHVQNFYDLDWEIQPFGKDLIPLPEINIPRPQKLKKMIETARDLADPFPYVRVDFYEVSGRIIFGELTFFPASGLPDFIPPEYDKVVGDLLTLPPRNN